MAYLDRPECLETDGIFRKAGSSARQRKLRQEIEAIQTFDHTALDDIDISLASLDCASVLKQWLRELQEPLIPTRFHDLLLKCCALSNPEDKINAIMLSSLLLPPLHSATLTCLTRFLSKVASYSTSNKMDSKSLAIVFAPGLFHASGDEMLKGSSKSGNEAGTFNMKMAVAEALINNASKVCMLQDSIYDTLQAINCLSHSEDNIDAIEKRNDDITGPSARRRKKKKRRSGSMSRVFTAMKGISRILPSSRSATPAGTRCNSSTNIASNDNIYVAAEKSIAANLSTPDYLKTPNSYYTPIIPSRGTGANANLISNGKRKGSQFDPLSATSKQSKGAVLNATPVTQPVNRGRSITLKLKKKKSIAGQTEIDILASAVKNESRLQTGIEGSRDKINYASCTTTPLPSKPTFSSLIKQQYPTSSFQVPNTPGTPGSFGVPSAVKDLSGFGSSIECLSDVDASSSFNSFQGKKQGIRNHDTKTQSPLNTGKTKELNKSKHLSSVLLNEENKIKVRYRTSSIQQVYVDL